MSPGEFEILVLDNVPTRGDMIAFQFLPKNHSIAVSLPPHLTHVMQPIDVCRARSFKASYRHFLKAYTKEDVLVRSYSLLGRAAQTGARSTAGDSRVSIAFAIVDAAKTATVTFIASHCFSVTGLFPFDARKPLGSKYVRACDDDVEGGHEAMRSHLLRTGSRILTAPAFLQLLTNRHAPKEVAELERKNLALERLSGPREVGLSDPDPDGEAEAEGEGEDEERAEIDSLEPVGHTFKKLLAEDERVDPSAPSDGED
jgi:hypothetical protein